MKPTSIEEFYRETASGSGADINALLPQGITKEIGHFNVFGIADVSKRVKKTGTMPYNRREYYKISLINGRNRAEYADKVIHIDQHALLFATPRIPYHWIPEDEDQSGDFCIFTGDFFSRGRNDIAADDLPIFQAGAYPVFQLSGAEAEEIAAIFRKMHREINSDYAYKYDLLRNYVMELIHYGQKLQPATALYPAHTAAARVSSLFIELLERQFPIESPQQRLKLRTAKDYAAMLSVHVNHLNKVLKEHTGKTTTALIGSRVIREAKILLRQTDWNVSEIAQCLGFEETAHFSNFFRKHTAMTPVSFRA
jgi:AraC family transcriptional regulator, transcriptional activator of pobA